MTESWTLTKLFEILQPVLRPERVDPTKEYRLLGIRLDGAGPFHRETIQGSQSAATTLYQVKSSDFIYSRLFACRGAFGIIDSNLDGCYVSGEFPTFVPINDRVDINFLRLWFRLPMTIRKVESDCTGSTPLTRNRFKKNFFLNLEIFLPPLAEQRRIVAKIDELAAKIEEARRLRQQATQEVDAFNRCMPKRVFQQIEQEFKIKEALGILVQILGGGTPSKHNYLFWNGVIPWVSPKDMKVADIFNSEDHITPEAISASAVNLIPQNSVLVVVRSGILRRTIPVAINRVPVTINQDMKALLPRPKILPEYLRWWFRAKEDELLECVKGGTTVQSLVWDRVIALDVCVPPLAEQRRIVNYLDESAEKLEELRRSQSETTAELVALLPSVLDKAFQGGL